MVNFIPEPVTTAARKVPYFEDSQDQKIPGRRTEKSVEKLQTEIRDLMMQLDAGNIFFSPGKFEVVPGVPARYGWLMTFSVNGLKGRMEIAALRESGIAPDYKFPLGMAIAVAELVGCWKAESVVPHISEHERLFGNFEASRVAWEFKAVQRFV